MRDAERSSGTLAPTVPGGVFSLSLIQSVLLVCLCHSLLPSCQGAEFRSDMNSGIKKGDILIGPDETIYLLDWEVPPQPNNMMSRALRCNVVTSFMRYQEEEVDDNGYLIAEEGWAEIAGSIPCNAYRHDGRLEFSANSHLPGVIPNTVTLISVQYNEKTKNIKPDDIFVWGNDTYVVADVNLVGVNIHETSGVIQLQAKKKAGGSK